LPINHARATVHDQVWGDLSTSSGPLVVAGYASIENIVNLAAELADKQPSSRLRVLLGTEPFVREHPSFGSPDASFTDEVRHFWYDEGISLTLSAKLVQTLAALDSGVLEVRFVPGSARLHAKIFVGDRAAILGSSNFTHPGMRHQLEANVRFDRAAEPDRYNDVVLTAENYWRAGKPWDEEFAALLRDLLRVVPWREALARACADLLDGQWASRYLRGSVSATTLWPSQV
jgi:phosphatidylserine/phosphatidylglycerophosphate/cardiolipin synthase-like enzyme